MANAKEAKVSIIRFIQSIWMGLRTYCFNKAAPIKVQATATTLTVSWNWINFLIESYIFLPHKTAFTIELKLSSSKTISDAYIAT